MDKPKSAAELGWRGDCPNCRTGVLCAVRRGWVCLQCRRRYSDKELKTATKKQLP